MCSDFGARNVQNSDIVIPDNMLGGSACMVSV